MIRLFHLLFVIGFISLIYCKTIEFIDEEVDGSLDEEHTVKTKLPVLLKQLRLRHFAYPQNKIEYYPDGFKKQLRMRPYYGRKHDDEARKVEREIEYIKRVIKGDEGQQIEDEIDGFKRSIGKREAHTVGRDDKEIQKAVEGSDVVLEYDQDKIPGYKLIGRHRRPHGPYRQKVFPLPVHQRIRTLRRGKSASGCNDDDNKVFISCFKTYFENFMLTVVDKLPLIEKVYEEMNKNVDYIQNQEWHHEFKQCYESLSTECFKSSNFIKIIENPEESDIYSAFFTSAEYIYIDKHYQDLISCFIDNMEPMPLIFENDTPEDKNNKCEIGENKVKNAQIKFMENCKNLESTDDEYKQWFNPFIKRQSVGEYCPRINVFLNNL